MAGENVARKPEVVADVAVSDHPKEITVELKIPVQAHGDTLKKITFRRPTGGDLMTLGGDYPINIDSMGYPRPNPMAMGLMMSTLASVPPSTIKSMDAKDWVVCAYALVNFFLP